MLTHISNTLIMNVSDEIVSQKMRGGSGAVLLPNYYRTITNDYNEITEILQCRL
jgi:hypothetical protein